MSEELNKWREAMRRTEIRSCGRLDMATYMPENETLGRVTSDRVRYVYFEDGSECIVLGKFCDHVAFRAADYDARIAQLEAELQEQRVRAVELRAERESIRVELGGLADSKLDGSDGLAAATWREVQMERQRIAALEAERDELGALVARVLDWGQIWRMGGGSKWMERAWKATHREVQP